MSKVYLFKCSRKRTTNKEVFPMSGTPQTNRFVTFSEVFLSRELFPTGSPNPVDEFVSYELVQGEESGTVSITRSDGKFLSFDVTRSDGTPVIEIGGNVIRWSAYPELHSDGHFQ
jgi:hypothetical protein